MSLLLRLETISVLMRCEMLGDAGFTLLFGALSKLSYCDVAIVTKCIDRYVCYWLIFTWSSVNI